MSTDATGTDTTPEIDTSEKETPAVADRQHPDTGNTTSTLALLAGVAVVANVIVHVIAMAAGADMQADLGSMTLDISWFVVMVATAVWVGIAVLGWSLVGHRVPAFAHLWVPLHWGMAVVAMAAIVAVTTVPTAITLGIMTVIATLVAAHAVPRRLPRR